MRKLLATLLCCILIPVTTFAVNPSLNSNQKTVNTERALGSGSGQSYQERKAQESLNGPQFGSQVGNFSFSYLWFITHYMAGATMLFGCRNPIGAMATLGVGAILPFIHLDNVVFSLGGLVSLYTDLMIFDHLEMYYKAMDAEMQKGSGSGGTDGEDLQRKGLELLRDSMNHEIEMMTIKAQSVRATKSIWLLSAALSAALGIATETAAISAAAGGTGGGAAAGAAIGVWILGIGAAAGASYGASIGSVAGSVLANMIRYEFVDWCSPLFTYTGSHLSAMGIEHIYTNYMSGSENHGEPPAMRVAPPAGGRTDYKMMEQILKNVGPVVKNSSSFEELLFSLVERRQGRSLTTKEYAAIKESLKNEKINLADEDFQLAKKYLTQIMAPNFIGDLKRLMEKFNPIAKAQAQTSSESMQEGIDTQMDGQESDQITDHFNIFKDFKAVSDTATNLNSLASDSEMAKDGKAMIHDPLSNAIPFMQKYLSWEFFVKFAGYLGFSNGGEIGFIAYLTVMGDLLVLKPRSWLLHPIVPFFYSIDGTWGMKLVSSMLAAFSAAKWRTEILQNKATMIELRTRVLQVLEQLPPPGPTTGGVTRAGGSAPAAAAQSLTSNSVAAPTCINTKDSVGPQSIGDCSPEQRKVSNAFPIDQPANKDAIGSLGDIGTSGFASLSGGLNSLAAGDRKGANKNLGELNASGPTFAAAVKENLKLLNKKFPERKIAERLKKFEALQVGRLNNALRSLGKVPPLNTSSPSLAMAGKGGAGAEGGSDKKQIEDLLNGLKKKIAMPAMPNFAMPKFDKIAPPTMPKTTSDLDSQYKEAQKADYEYTDEQIIKDQNESIFKQITIRYFKTVYPMLFQKK